MRGLAKLTDGMLAMLPADPAELIQNLALLLPPSLMITRHDGLDILAPRDWTHAPLPGFGNRDYESTNPFWTSFGNMNQSHK